MQKLEIESGSEIMNCVEEKRETNSVQFLNIDILFNQ